MPDHYIKGRSPTYRDSGGGGSLIECLLSAHFTVPIDGTQTLTGDESAAVHWDERDSSDSRQWDRIGFPADYFGGSYVFLPPGAAAIYLIVAYVQFVAQTAWSTGTVVVQLDTAEEPKDAQSAALTASRTVADVSVSGVHRFDPDSGDGVSVAISTVGVDDSVVINKASISFVKICDAPAAGPSG